MPYEPVAHGKLEGLDYQATRPFFNWRRPDLLEKIQEWVALNPPRLELATLAYEEVKNRGENRAKPALRLFPKHLPPIPWLAAARQDVLAELEPSTTPRANGRLYVILRSGYTEMNGFYGAYVGVTSHRVEERFRQHLTGIRAASGLQNHGIELLYSLFSWANPVPEAKTSGAYMRQSFTNSWQTSSLQSQWRSISPLAIKVRRSALDSLPDFDERISVKSEVPQFCSMPLIGGEVDISDSDRLTFGRVGLGHCSSS